MTKMTKHWDTMFGWVGALGTVTIGHINLYVGTAVGLVTLAVMLFRLRREWLNRNEPRDEE